MKIKSLLHFVIFAALIYICPGMIQAQQSPAEGLNPPINVKAKADNIIVLTWGAPAVSSPTLAGYDIYRSSATDGIWKKLNRKPVEVLKYKDDDYIESEKYYYIVCAVDQDGQLSKPSSIVETMAPFRYSSIVLLPTAYRDKKNTPGLEGLVNFSYYIGNLYTEYDWYGPGGGLIKKNSLFDRLGITLFAVNTKFVFSTEKDSLLNLASGIDFAYLFQDASAREGKQAAQGATMNLSAGEEYVGTFFVGSKKLGANKLHCGVMMGNRGNAFMYFLNSAPGAKLPTEAERKQFSDGLLYAGVHSKMLSFLPLTLEYIQPMERKNPWMLNIFFGSGLSFQFSYFHYQTDYGVGYAVLGYINAAVPLFQYPK